MWGITKNTWDYYQTYGLVPGMAQPIGKKTINKNNIYKFNHQKAMIPVSMMNAYGIRPNGSFAPGGLANENRRRTEKYITMNKSRSQSPSLPEPPPISYSVPPLPPPSPISTRSNSSNSNMYENTKVYEPAFIPIDPQTTRSGRISRPPSRPTYERKNRKTRNARKTRKTRKTQTRKA
jgi:hypothetical protein